MCVQFPPQLCPPLHLRYTSLSLFFKSQDSVPLYTFYCEIIMNLIEVETLTAGFKSSNRSWTRPDSEETRHCGMVLHSVLGREMAKTDGICTYLINLGESTRKRTRIAARRPVDLFASSRHSFHYNPTIIWFPSSEITFVCAQQQYECPVFSIHLILKSPFKSPVAITIS